MLSQETIKQINDLVYIKPRTVHEIAQTLTLNWRTADTYVEKIASELGTIGTRTFRGGTRGALKVVYWNNLEKIHGHQAQEDLFDKIKRGVEKKDFSPFDIYQHIAIEKRRVVVDEPVSDFAALLRGAQEQVLIFSGNLSWTRLGDKYGTLLGVLEEIAQRKVSVKIITRIDLPGISNIMNVESINNRVGWAAIEIRHVQQPLRSVVVNSKLVQMKEVKDPADFAAGELKKKMELYYHIMDEEWVEWIGKVFFHFFRMGIPYKKRIEDLQSVQKVL